jgi:DNA-directed RNA polymerase specialized sigma24 family protein
MKREPVVDFFQVEAKHIKIHERLVNWARWAHSPQWGRVQPMFRLYRPDEHWEGQSPISSVDTLDAAKIQKAVSKLPEKHRSAIGWNYVKRNNPKRAAQELGVNVQGLAQLIADGRQMLINRGE